MFHWSPSQLCKNSSFWTWSVSLKRSQSWSVRGREDFCLLYCTSCSLWSIEKPLLQLIIIREVQRWSELSCLHQMENFIVLPSFNLCESWMYCVKGIKSSLDYASKYLNSFFFLEGICKIKSCIVSALQIRQLRRKVLPCFWKCNTNCDHYRQAIYRHELSMFRLSNTSLSFSLSLSVAQLFKWIKNLKKGNFVVEIVIHFSKYFF